MWSKELKINVKEENSDKVIWFKERFLDEEEIVEHVVHNESRKVCWTMHRPRNGWYIRIRSPSFPPADPTIAEHAPPVWRALIFFAHKYTHRLGRALPSEHVHGPLIPTHTPAGGGRASPTPASVQAKLEQAQGKQRGQPPPTQVTEFVLAPYTGEVIKPEQMTFFQRAFSVIKSQTAGPSYSFTLARVRPPSAPSPPSYVSPTNTTPMPSPVESTVPLAAPVAQPPLLTFHDRTPTMTVNTITGLIEVDQAEEAALGVDSSFWIAVALTYLEFLQEKESYLAALSEY
ncbi:hypothetical protein B0H13DRAFT_247224 [Mycena leptocephala]|nr:hypothetical protein B0H13DRAFT_247224 [Mycena leptocephala]